MVARGHEVLVLTPARVPPSEPYVVRSAVAERAAAFERSRIGGTFEVIPNGVDTAAFAAASPVDVGPGTKLLFVGRLDERKGFPVALETFRRLAASRDDLRLVVAGD